MALTETGRTPSDITPKDPVVFTLNNHGMSSEDFGDLKKAVGYGAPGKNGPAFTPAEPPRPRRARTAKEKAAARNKSKAARKSRRSNRRK